jgi:opacity protein-like surface antigen
VAFTTRSVTTALAGAAVLALLAGCASSAEPEAEEERPRAESNGSNLPFDIGQLTTDPEPDDDPTPTETTAQTTEPQPDDSPSGGGSGGTVVKFDDVDISDVDWDTSCSDDYVLSSASVEGSNAYNNVSVSIESDGSVGYVMIDAQTGESLYYSADLSTGATEPSMTYDNESIQVSGEGIIDNDRDNIVKFEISLTCDSSY